MEASKSLIACPAKCLPKKIQITHAVNLICSNKMVDLELSCINLSKSFCDQ